MQALFNLVGRYAMGAAGPIASAAAQFLLSLILLRQLDAHAFGSFSFLLVAAQLSLGVWGALFCAPLPVLAAASDDEKDSGAVRQAMSTACLFGALAGGVVFLLLGLALDVDPRAALWFAGFGAVSLLRWYARAESYVAGQPLRPLASDLAYSGVLTVGVVVLFAHRDAAGLGAAFGWLFAAAVAGLLPFGRSYVVRQFMRLSPRGLRHYLPIWRHHARWSLIGVVTTELTANAHAYLVTLAYGPASFAAVAASALLIRPVTVVQNALGEFERPRLARDLAHGGIDAAAPALRAFRYGLLAAWGATAVAIVALFALAPRLIFPDHYAISTLVVGAVLWMAVALVRLARTPESILLQSAGEFRGLAWASVVSCGWSIGAVGAMIAVLGPLWSIAGVLLGEVIFAVWIWRQLRLWRGSLGRDGIVPVAAGS